MTLVPPSDRVLCRLVEPETRTRFGLELPEIAQETPLRATVLAVGAGTRHPLAGQGLVLADQKIGLGEYDDVLGFRRRLAPGDEVILPRRGGSEIVTADGETVISILASEILARAEG